jgi:hypothetical protein
MRRSWNTVARSDVRSIRDVRGTEPMNRPEQRGLRGAFALAVVDEVNRDGHAQRVAQKNEFVPGVIAVPRSVSEG